MLNIFLCVIPVFYLYNDRLKKYTFTLEAIFWDNFGILELTFPTKMLIVLKKLLKLLFDKTKKKLSSYLQNITV